jgi:hypothetical protein
MAAAWSCTDAMSDAAQAIVDALRSAEAAAPCFTQRAAAIERLEYALDRLRPGEPQAPGVAALQARAHALHRRLEADNARFIRRLRARIRAGRYRGEGLERALARQAPAQRSARDYDALDELIACLLDAGELPDQRVALGPDMVAYQPTPGALILSLVQRAEIRSRDVFYDLGAGLGWVVILVALLRGADARGIELEPSYCEYARACASALGLRNVTFVGGDAREASLADGSVFYMYTPFRGELLRRVLDRLQGVAHERPIRVCTYGPCTRDVAQAAWLRLRPGCSVAPDEIAVFETR